MNAPAPVIALSGNLLAEDSGRAVRAYLASLQSPASRRAMRSALNQVGRILTSNEGADAFTVPWTRLRYEHMSALRAHLAIHYQPASANTLLSAVRGVLRNAWQLGALDTDSYMRAVAVKSVRGTRLPAGRALNPGELRALFGVCASDRKPAGARDAAAFALLFGAGLRRSEAVSVQLDEYDRETGALTVTGKGNRQRIVYATNGGADALKAWIAVRGDHDGALLAPVNKGGTVQPRSMTAQALMYRLKVRARQAGIAPCSPHDLRRTFVSELLDAGADIATVQRLAGHASPATTARYDRRGERTKERAAQMLIVPYLSPLATTG